MARSFYYSPAARSRYHDRDAETRRYRLHNPPPRGSNELHNKVVRGHSRHRTAYYEAHCIVGATSSSSPKATIASAALSDTSKVRSVPQSPQKPRRPKFDERNFRLVAQPGQLRVQIDRYQQSIEVAELLPTHVAMTDRGTTEITVDVGSARRRTGTRRSNTTCCRYSSLQFLMPAYGIQPRRCCRLGLRRRGSVIVEIVIRPQP